MTKTELFAIRLFATLMIATGITATLDIIVGIVELDFTFNLGFLCFFIGKGLLEYKERWRYWAEFITLLYLIFSSISLLLLPFFGEGIKTTIAGITSTPTLSWQILFWIALACLVGYSFWMFRLLARASVRREFSKQGRETDNWWKVIAVFSVIVSMAIILPNEYREKEYEKILGEVDYYEATIKAVDAKSGKPLTLLIISDIERDPKDPFRKKSISSGASASEAFISWLGTKPITVEVSVKGYESQKVELCKDKSREEITLKLSKLKQSQ